MKRRALDLWLFLILMSDVPTYYTACHMLSASSAEKPEQRAHAKFAVIFMQSGVATSCTEQLVYMKL